jgi:hypothetical protein
LLDFAPQEPELNRTGSKFSTILVTQVLLSPEASLKTA